MMFKDTVTQSTTSIIIAIWEAKLQTSLCNYLSTPCIILVMTNPFHTNTGIKGLTFYKYNSDNTSIRHKIYIPVHL